MDSEAHNLYVKYAELHDSKSVELYEKLLNDSSLSDIKDYLEELSNVFDQLDGPYKAHTWKLFALGNLKHKVILSELSVEKGSDLDKKLVQLAFFHRFPKYAQQGFNHQKMIKALDAPSISEGEIILKPDAPKDPIHLQIIKDGYSSDYKRHDTVVVPMLNYLDKFATEWSSTDHLAPYTSIIGPTMIGKTRLVMELSHHVCVVYLCLRPKGSTGEPPRSELADQMLNISGSDVRGYYQRLVGIILDQAARFFSKQDPSMSVQDRLLDWNLYQKSHELDLAEEVREQLRLHATNGQKQDISLLKGSVNKIHANTKFITGSKLKVLFALDEARGLLESKSGDLTYFRWFRRALSEVPDSKGFFTVLLDTTSVVANFTPATHVDPSARNDVGGDKLFPPLYSIGTLDSMVLSSQPSSWEELLSPTRLFRYGFPIFHLYAQSAIEMYSIEEVIKRLSKFAESKLLCLAKHTQTPSSRNLSEGQIFALLGSTIQPQIHQAARLNSELISSYAAHCFYISLDRERQISGYPSQFIFSVAANNFLASDESMLIVCIKALRDILRQGLISSGNAGELASRIILLHAMHQTWKKTSHNCQGSIPGGQSVRVVDFLEVLTGSKEGLSLSNENPYKKRLLKEGRIFWNHFVEITYTPSSNDFLEFLYRGLAVQCKPGQPQFDQLFTIYLQPTPDSNLDQKNITFCGVQVKNAKSVDYRDQENWTAEKAGIDINPENPYLFILFSFQTKWTKQSFSLIDDRISLVFHGLSKIKCLTPQIAAALEELLKSDPDLRTYSDDENVRKFVEIASPATYPIVRGVESSDIEMDT